MLQREPDMIKTFQQNWKLYCSEALGLAIFMVSACFFGAMLEGDTALHKALPNGFTRLVMTGILMGSTALFIFYSPFTAPSGSHINPAVTIAFFRLKKITKLDAFFYILFQFIGGTIAVYAMAYIMDGTLTKLPVNYVATVPMKSLPIVFLTEFLIAFVMMTMVLNTSSHYTLKKYTRLLSGCFVCLYVITAGPISGFGMNPARSFASALPSGTWTAFWIYSIVPVIGMLLATEVYLRFQNRKLKRQYRKGLVQYLENQSAISQPLKKTV
jgi:aquaporin Z